MVERATLRLEALTIAGARAADYEGPGGDLVIVHDARFEAVDVGFARAPFGPPDDDPDRPYGVGTGLVLRGAAVAELVGVELRHHRLGAVEVHDRAYLLVDDTDFVENHLGILIEGNARFEMRAGRFTRSRGKALVVFGTARVTARDIHIGASGETYVALNRDLPAVEVGAEAELRS